MKKNILFIFGMLAMVSALSLVFAGCDAGNDDGTDHSGLYGVYRPGNNNYTSFGNVSLTETTITIKGSPYNITLGDDTPFTIYGQKLYIVYIYYNSKKVGAVIAKPNPELFLGMSLDAAAAWSVMGSAPAYIVEDDLGVFCGDKDDSSGGDTTFPAEFIGTTWKQDGTNHTLIFSEDEILCRFNGIGGITYYLVSFNGSVDSGTFINFPESNVEESSSTYSFTNNGTTFSISFVTGSTPPQDRIPAGSYIKQ
jgi:hypothetical protein